MKASELIEILERNPDYNVVVDGIRFYNGGWEGDMIEDPFISTNQDRKTIYIEGTEGFN